MDHIDEEAEIQDESILTIQEQLFSLRQMQGYVTGSYGFCDDDITVQNVTFEDLSKIKLEDVEAWYSAAAPFAYGNVVSQQTEYSHDVRLSRELDATKFRVPGSF
jgi:hypothetical protein